MQFESNFLPLRAMAAKYAAWVVTQLTAYEPGPKSKAAKLLGISRNTLDSLLKEADSPAQRQANSRTL